MGYYFKMKWDPLWGNHVNLEQKVKITFTLIAAKLSSALS